MRGALEDYELEVLSKYRRGEIVSPGDESVLERFENIGVCRTGFTTNTEDGIPRQTARLTPRGLSLVKTERMYRSPIRRTLQSFLNSLAG